MGFFRCYNTFIWIKYFTRHWNWREKIHISLSGARTHESISSGQKFFVRFLVQMKTAKSPFEINWPLIKSQFHHIWSGCQSKAFKYLRRRHIILNSQLQSLQPSLFSTYWSENWQHAIMWRSTHEQRQVKLLWLFHFFRYYLYLGLPI